MPGLQRVRVDHGPAILDFEVENRAYFASFISDRGDEFFEHFAQQHDELMTEQQGGIRACYLLVDEDASVLGRFNLVFVGDGVAEVGYRMAERAAGRGLATAAVGELCRLAASEHGVRTLRAAVADRNLASQRVLLKNGFVPVGPTDPTHMGGRVGTWYSRRMTDDAWA